MHEAGPRSGNEAAGVPDRRFLAVLVLDPDLDDHARGAVVRLLVLATPCTVRRSPA
jgi:hypothetical protein